MRRRLAKYVLFFAAISIFVYSAAVTHPNTVMARKACTSWDKNEGVYFKPCEA